MRMTSYSPSPNLKLSMTYIHNETYDETYEVILFNYDETYEVILFKIHSVQEPGA